VPLVLYLDDGQHSQDVTRLIEWLLGRPRNIMIIDIIENFFRLGPMPLASRGQIMHGTSSTRSALASTLPSNTNKVFFADLLYRAGSIGKFAERLDIYAENRDSAPTQPAITSMIYGMNPMSFCT
jgi:hypothetical protein